METVGSSVVADDCRPGRPNHCHQHKQNNHPAGGTKGREKRGRRWWWKWGWVSGGAELEGCQGRGGVVESGRLSHPPPPPSSWVLSAPQLPYRLILEGNAHFFFFFFFKCSAAHFSQSDGQPGGNVHGRHKPLRFLIHTLLSFSLCVAPEELYCPHAQQPCTLTNYRAITFHQLINKLNVIESVSFAF